MTPDWRLHTGMYRGRSQQEPTGAIFCVLILLLVTAVSLDPTEYGVLLSLTSTWPEGLFGALTT